MHCSRTCGKENCPCPVSKQTSVVLGLQGNQFYHLQMWPFVLNHMLARRVSSAPLITHLYFSLPVALSGHCPVGTCFRAPKSFSVEQAKKMSFSHVNIRNLFLPSRCNTEAKLISPQFDIRRI